MCDERERLLDYLYDACEADERRRVEHHLDECEGCRDEISGLRAVRMNLLAWDVPEHDSVWKPFAPARLRPWYREIPVWALAAAASVMFMLGLAGGLVSRRFAPTPQVAAVTPAPSPMVTPQVTPTATNADLAAMEHRILTVMQTQMDQRLASPVAAHSQTVSTTLNRDELLQEMQRMLAASERRVMQSMLQDSQRTFVTQSRFNSFRNSELPALVHWEAAQASQQQGNRQ
jgi:hypothetical protein